jgi:DNA polymerase I-like protein with 3'-5' exonuclease and polymerase domains/5'-3' exonuclease
MKRWLLLDMSSIGWQNLLAGKDKENGREVAHPTKEGKTVYVNSAEYGFENFVSNLSAHLERFKAAPRDIVMVFEGKNAKLLRQSINPNYKAGRDHAPEQYEEFTKLLDKIRATLLELGALAVWQDGIEADDVLCYLAKNLKSPRTVISNDGDLLVLREDKSVDVYNTGRGELNVNKYGPFAERHITLYKALVGDPSDNVKGAHGFGHKAFIDLLCEFGEEGLDVMVELIKSRELGRLVEDLPRLKSLQKVIDDQEAVYQSYDIVSMYPDKVNTLRKPLERLASRVVDWDEARHDARLKKWYGHRFLAGAADYEEAKGFAMGHLFESPSIAFDIETSTPRESDEWMEAKKRGAAGEDGAKVGVDVFGSRLTGASFTFGKNMNYTLYFPVDHVEKHGTLNVRSEQVRQFAELVPDSIPLVVQNASFELVVCYMEWGAAWANNGWHGFLPNVHDTKIMKSYVDENSPLGLKDQSKTILGYEQVSYKELTQNEKYKMAELSAEEVFDYGTDDTICTAALENHHRFFLELEGTWDVYDTVERLPLYLNAHRFVTGTAISIEKMRELEKEDAAAAEKAWTVVRAFLIKSGWAGTVCPTVEKPADLTAAKIKEIFQLVTGAELRKEDGKAVTIRTPEKLAAFIEERDGLLASCLRSALDGAVQPLNDLIKVHFKGEPEFNPDSPPQMRRLLYEVMGLPIRLRKRATDDMRKKGIREGNPRGDDFALQFAVKFDADKGEEVLTVVKAIQDMRVFATRRKLYYVPYRFVQHWRDNLVHAQVNQSVTVTRRYSSSDPNLQQLPKNAKHGHKARFREVYIPHKKNAVIVSFDFNAQELRNIAEQSQDPNLLACYVPPPGQKKKDMHALTAAAIWKKKSVADLCRMIGIPEAQHSAASARWSGMNYDKFIEIYKDPTNVDHKLAEELRQLGKKTNFTTEYGAQAQKLAETLVITPEEAQMYIDAKYAQFPRAEAWKKEVVAGELNKLGYTTTMLGARRHLREQVLSSNRIESSGAERQGVNHKVQSSCAEQTKLAEGRFWKSGVPFKYDCVYIGPIHDEVVWSVVVDERFMDFLREVHSLMVENYAGMKVPVISSVSLGPDFGQQIELGETIDEPVVWKALAKLGLAPAMTTA